LLFFLLVLLSLLASSCNEIWASNFGFQHWYLGLEGKWDKTRQTVNKFLLSCSIQRRKGFTIDPSFSLPPFRSCLIKFLIVSKR
jgi:hypothetical protein